MSSKRLKAPFTVELQKEIEQVIGKKILLSRGGTLDFTDLTDVDLSDLHKLFGAHGHLVTSYLDFLLKEEISFSMMKMFHVVAEKKMSLNEWIEKLYPWAARVEKRNSD